MDRAPTHSGSSVIRFAITTFPDEEVATRVIHELVEARLAACGTILPGAQSIYQWNGAIQKNAEVLAIFKLLAEGYRSFEHALLERHPYDTPEVAAFDPTDVSSAYADWVLTHCKAPTAS